LVRRGELPARAACRVEGAAATAAADGGARVGAIVVVLLYTGLRLAEHVALDVDDVRSSARN
jgi:hypothetical protein